MRANSSRNPIRFTLLAIALLILPLFLSRQAEPVYAAAIEVNSISDDLTDDDDCTLREAIMNANGDDQSGDDACVSGSGEDTITFTMGAGGSSHTITLASGLPPISDPAGLIIDGTGRDITINGFGNQVFFVNATVPLTLQKLIITGGFSLAGGGAHNLGMLTVIESTFIGNSGLRGGAIGNYGILNVSGSTFQTNVAGEGGAIYSGQEPFTNARNIVAISATVTGSTFIGNQAGIGGAIYTIANILGVTSNSADVGPVSTMEITNSTFSENGTFVPDTLATNSINTAVALGGAIFHGVPYQANLAGSDPDQNGRSEVDDQLAGLIIGNSTFFNNGYLGSNALYLSGPALLTNTIFSGDPSGQQCVTMSGGAIVDSGANISQDASCGFGVAGGLNSTNPQLFPLGANGGPTLTHALQPGSPAIDLASSAVCAALPVNGVDQRGAPRNVDIAGWGSDTTYLCDSGAYEAGDSLITIIKDAIPPDGTNFTFAYAPHLYCASGSHLADSDCDTAGTPNGVVYNFQLDDADPDDTDGIEDRKTFGIFFVGGTNTSGASTSGASTSGASTSGASASGLHTFTEQELSGWSLTDLTCTGALIGDPVNTVQKRDAIASDSIVYIDLEKRQVDVDLFPGDHVTCTFSNAKPGITIIKDAEPAVGTDFSFQMDHNVCTAAAASGSPQDSACLASSTALSFPAFFLLDDADPDDGDGVPDREFFGPLESGEYTISEAELLGWRLEDITCEGATLLVPDAANNSDTPATNNASATSTYSVDLLNRLLRIRYVEGDHVACTFTNQATTGVTIIKDAEPPDGTDFPFEALITGVGSVQTAVFAANNAADKLESNVPNADVLPIPFILDDAVPDDGDAYGDRQTFYFLISESAAGSAHNSPLGEDQVAAPVFDITVTEEEVAGWKLKTLECTGQVESTVTPDVDGRSVQIELRFDEFVTCTFSNEQAAAIKIIESYAVTRVVEGLFSGEGSKACYWINSTVPLDGDVVIDIAPLGSEVTVDKSQVTLDSTNWNNLNLHGPTFVCIRPVDDDIDDGTPPPTICKEGADDLYGSNLATTTDEECGDHQDFVKHTIVSSTDSIVSTGTDFMSNNTVRDLDLPDPDPSTVDALIIDNDEAGVILTESFGVSDLDELGTPVGKACYWITLASEPVGSVVVTASPFGATEVEIDKTDVTLDASNWNIIDTGDPNAHNQICITPINENDIDTPNPVCHIGSADLLGPSGTGTNVCGTHFEPIYHSINTSADPNYNIATPYTGNGYLPNTSAVNVLIRDDNVAAVTFNPATVNILEGGAESYDVTLSSKPKAAVKVTGEEVDLTFQPAGWNVPQTVTVAAEQDNAAEGPQTLQFAYAVSSADPDYNQLAVKPLEVTVVDDDTAGVLLSTTLLELSEDGETAVYDITLTSQPRADVQVDLSSSGQLHIQPANLALKRSNWSIAQVTLTFTPDNWDTPQRVQVTGIDDQVDESELHSARITHTVRSSDTDYADIAVAGILATIADNDKAGVSADKESVAVSEDGTLKATYNVRLLSRPTEAVTVQLDGGGQAQTAPASVTFEPDKWDQPQNVKVTAIDDNIDEGYVYSTALSQLVVSEDAYYNGLQLDPLSLSITDNDTAGVHISTATIFTAGGAEASYRVSLASEPTGPVVIDLAAAGAVFLDDNVCAEGEGGASCLLFTPDNWHIEQEVRFKSYGHGRIEHQVSSADGRYNAIETGDVLVNALYNIFMPVARGN